MWQKKFEQFGGENFTIVGLALDSEGVSPAKKYYDHFGVTFPALVDPDYATQFGAVPKTFFVAEDGKVLALDHWEQRLDLVASTSTDPETSAKWSQPGKRLEAGEIRRLSLASAASPQDLALATELGSRYLALGLKSEAQAVLQRSVDLHDSQAAIRWQSVTVALLGQAYFQLARCAQDRQSRVEFAEMSFFLNPSVGFGKQIARMISPEKFDGRPQGDFDNQFREATLKRLQRERAEWLK